MDFGRVASTGVSIVFAFPLLGLRLCAMKTCVSGFQSKAVFVCTYPCLDLAGLVPHVLLKP